MMRTRGIKLAKFQVIFEETNCVGCGNCVEVCSENWKLTGGVSSPLNTALEVLGCNRRAADEYPESCIAIVEQ